MAKISPATIIANTARTTISAAGLTASSAITRLVCPRMCRPRRCLKWRTVPLSELAPENAETEHGAEPMKRFMACIALVVGVLLVAPTAVTAAPRSSNSTDVEGLKWARRLNFFYFGSGANPLLNGTCGRVFSGAYILPAATEPGQERSCTIPAGLPILASPAGSIAWAPTDGSTPEELSAARDAGLAGLTARRATLDGASLPLQLVKNFVHPLKLQPGNLVQTVDPNVKGTSTLVATGTWLTWIRDLAPGHHTAVLSDKINGASADITLHPTVQSLAEDLSVKGSYTGTGAITFACTNIGVDAQGSGNWTALQATTFTLHFCNANSNVTIHDGRFTITTAEGTMPGDLTG